MSDPFVGTWTLDPARSTFDPNHRPTSATLVFTLEAEGNYVMTAEGVADGKKVTERPSRFVTDGVERPLPDYPEITVTSSRPERRTLHSVAKRSDGSTVGESTIVVSPDGKTLTASNSGIDAQFRTFTLVNVFARA